MFGIWCPVGAEEIREESEKEVSVEGHGLIERTFHRQTVNAETFKETFKRVAQSISWAFEDMDPSRAIEKYTTMMERSPGDPLRGSVNAFSSLLTPDQFDAYTLQEEFNRALTIFCLKQHATKFRKRRWDAMRCTSQVYLLEDPSVHFDGVSDTRKYETQAFPAAGDGRPVMVQMEREQESTATLDSRSLFSYRMLHTLAIFVWPDGGESRSTREAESKLNQASTQNHHSSSHHQSHHSASPYSDKENLVKRVAMMHKRFAQIRKPVEERFENLFTVSPMLQIRLQKAFTFLDVTRDGCLDTGELKAMLCRARERDVDDEETERAMKFFDPSGNGTIEPSEFLQYMISKGSLQDAALPLSRLEMICRVGFKCNRKKANSDSLKPLYIEIDPFSQILAIYDEQASSSYEQKFKSQFLKKTIDLKTRIIEKPDEIRYAHHRHGHGNKKKHDTHSKKGLDQKNNDGDSQPHSTASPHSLLQPPADDASAPPANDPHPEDITHLKTTKHQEPKSEALRAAERRSEKLDDKRSLVPCTLKFVKSSDIHSSLSLVFSADDYQRVSALLERCVDKEAEMTEARPVVQELLVEAALPTLVLLPDY